MNTAIRNVDPKPALPSIVPYGRLGQAVALSGLFGAVEYVDLRHKVYAVAALNAS